ncbi:AraC family transcriptional regulator [Pseudoalteromonas sp. MMG013]|uniref:helix-turn-helix domain-containing protein n=1 Tax=Pseudoalteromonas sp. MMG013 TaxID=2822687 RepID=UPI001B370B45|nr:helix-turn-helix domain-containing protein [Pseudoalteromonas sp. MMG013]MBQ4862289.1 AraC family transcriptional regulator [Pseudoalteromonas sp. MMG013]
MPILFIEPGILAVHTQVLDTTSHQHALQQVTLPMSHMSLTIQLDQLTTYRCNSTAFILKSHVSHQLSMQSGWVILIEPSSALGQCIDTRLAQNALIQCPLQTMPTIHSDLKDLLALCHLKYVQNNRHLDVRIQSLLVQLDQCFTTSCIKPEHWLAKDIATQLNLSESRFLHLFKQNMQLPWRPYLLWRRLICAIKVISKGGSATQAAYIAGFSDSAHLSRTFKKQFGITLQKLLSRKNTQQ